MRINDVVSEAAAMVPTPAAQPAPGAVKKGGTLQPWLQGNKGTTAAQPTTPPPPPQVGTAPADMAKLSATVPAYKPPTQPTTPPPPPYKPTATAPADMAKLSATVPAYKPPTQPTTPPPPPYKPGATTPAPGTTPPPKPSANTATTTPPPPPSKPAPNAPAPTAPPIPGQPAATTPAAPATPATPATPAAPTAPAKPSLGADFDAGLAAQKAGGSPTAMLLAQPSIGGNQQLLDMIASGFGLPKGSTADDILSAEAARSAGKAPVAEDMQRMIELAGLAKIKINHIITEYATPDDGGVVAPEKTSEQESYNYYAGLYAELKIPQASAALDREELQKNIAQSLQNGEIKLEDVRSVIQLLKQQQGLAEGDMAEGVRVPDQQILGTKNRAQTAYYTAKPNVKKLDKPLNDQELARLKDLAGMKTK